MSTSSAPSAQHPNWALAPLLPLAERRGFTGDIAAFHHAVNVAFHACESQVYDDMHRCMWESLPVQFGLIASDCVQRAPGLAARRNLRLLDIGCGTGLSAQLLLDSPLGQHVTHVTLLDTAPEMLAKAEARVRQTGRTTETFCGELSALPPDAQFDVIITCSVLHHIPDVASFLRDVALRQRAGSLFVHMHDPNHDQLGSATSRARVRTLRDRGRYASLKNVAEKLGVKELAAGVRRLARPARLPDYMERMNAQLMLDGVIRTPMTRQEIYSVTDIHVGDEEGVSLDEIRTALAPGGYDCVSVRSYAFFGALQSELPPDLATREAQLIEERAPDGTQFGAAWIRRDDTPDAGPRLVP